MLDESYLKRGAIVKYEDEYNDVYGEFAKTMRKVFDDAIEGLNRDEWLPYFINAFEHASIDDEIYDFERYLRQRILNGDVTDKIEKVVPGARDLEKVANQYNDIYNEEWKNTKSAYRGTNLDEVDGSLKSGFLGRDNEEGFMPVSASKTVGTHFAKSSKNWYGDSGVGVREPVVMEFDKDYLEDNGLVKQGINFFSGRDSNNLMDPQGARFLYEREARVQHGTHKFDPSKITLHLDANASEESRKEHQQKYGKFFKTLVYDIG